MFDVLIIVIVIIAVFYILILRAIFSIGEIVKNLQKQTEEAEKQTLFQKGIYKNLRALIVTKEIDVEDIFRVIREEKEQK